MSHEIQKIIADLRMARLSKGMSQSELSRLSGIPQAQISRIEAGSVDIRLSSLVLLAHALDFEIELVPRKAIAAVKFITRQIPKSWLIQDFAISKELRRFQKTIRAIQANTSVNMPILDELQKTLDELKKPYAAFKPLQIDLKFLDPLRKIRMYLEHMQTLEQSFQDVANWDKITEATQNIKRIQNQIIDALPSSEEQDSQRPAYILDDDD